MPAFLTDIQALLFQWYQLSLDNIAYVITLVLVVWLPFNLYHRFRLAIAGRRHAQITRQLGEIQLRLEHMEREAATLRQEAADQRTVLEAERLASAELAQQHTAVQRAWQQKNRQLADMLHDLVHSLSLPDMAILFRSGGDDESVWQSSTHCVVKLGERLRAEMQGRQDVERSFRGLQETLAARDSQIQRLDNQLQQQLLLHKALQEKQEIVAPLTPPPAASAMPHHELASLLAQYQAGMLPDSVPVMPAPAAAEPVAVNQAVPEVPVPLPVNEAPPSAPVASPAPQSPVAEIPPATAALQEAVSAPAAKKGGLLGGFSMFGKKATASAAPPAPAPAAETPPPAPIPPASPAPVLAVPVAPVAVPPPVQPAPAVAAVIPQPQPAAAQPQKKPGFMQKLSKVYNAMSPEYVPVTKLGKESRSKMNQQD